MAAHVLIWLHIICMAGSLGILIFTQWGLPTHLRDSVEAGGQAVKFSSFLIMAGLFIGFGLYLQEIKSATEAAPLPSKLHMFVGIKLLMLFVIAGLLGTSNAALKKAQVPKASTVRVTAILLLATAAFLGVIIS